MVRANGATAIGGMAPTNGAAMAIRHGEPYTAVVAIKGTADILFHRWNCEAVEAKGKAAKGSAAKKTDDIESYVYRNDDGVLCIPGEYLRQAIIHAAKFRQDPRSPRKSAMDLFKAGVVSLTQLAPVYREARMGEASRDQAGGGRAWSGMVVYKEWDFEHKSRVVIQRSAITRVRPALKEGWTAEFELLVNTPEYIDDVILHEVVANAGRLVGLADFRPSYGRFMVTKFERIALG